MIFIHNQERLEVFGRVYMARLEISVEAVDLGMLCLTAFAIFQWGGWNMKRRTWEKEEIQPNFLFFISLGYLEAFQLQIWTA